MVRVASQCRTREFSEVSLEAPEVGGEKTGGLSSSLPILNYILMNILLARRATEISACRKQEVSACG